MTINDVILNCMTENNMVNNALLHSGIDVDALACRFFKQVQDAISGLISGGATEDDINRQAEHITGLPTLSIECIRRNVTNATFVKLALLLATGTGERISINPREIFNASIQQSQNDPDGEHAAFWLALAAESAMQVGNNECPF